MLSISKLQGNGSRDYYGTMHGGRYYDREVDERGRFEGGGARLLNLPVRVTARDFAALWEGYDPLIPGRKLVQNAGVSDRVAAYDLTFSSPKSGSLLWAFGNEETRLQYEKCLREAVSKTLAEVETMACVSRRGHGGCQKEKALLIAATFLHTTSRADEPQLHIHAVVPNVVVRSDGSTGALDSPSIYKSKMLFGALFRAELAAQLQTQMSVAIERRGSTFEIAGFSSEMLRSFSSRREAIEQHLSAAGHTSAASAEIAAFATRDAKSFRSLSDLQQDWALRGAEVGLSYETPRAILGMHDAPLLTEPAKRKLVHDALDLLTSRQNKFSSRDLLQQIALLAPGTGAGIADATDALHAAIRHDARLVQLSAGEAGPLYTTRDILDAEKCLIRIAEEGVGAVPALCSSTGGCTERLQELSEQQRLALKEIGGSRDRVVVLRGMAGTGKTAVLREVKSFAQVGGIAVLGAALSGKAADGLEAAAGIPSDTLHRLLARASSGELKIAPGSLVVIDEAAMIGTRQMLDLVRLVEKSDARLLLVGDDRQLQPVEAGGPFRGLYKRLGGAELTEIQRQRDTWSKRLVHDAASGHASSVLDELRKNGRLCVAPTRLEAVGDLINAWAKHGSSNPESHLILASTRADVRTLNRLAQGERLELGELGPVEMMVGDDKVREHDRILFTRNSRFLGVRNGSLGTVRSLNTKSRTAEVALDNGRLIRLNAKSYHHVELGYALTTHKAQGITIDHAYVLMGGHMQDREMSYVQLSRARETTRVYVAEADAGTSFGKLADDMSRSRQKSLAIDELNHSPNLHRPL